MKSRSFYLEVNGLCIEVLQKKIKNMHLRIYPPDGSIRISVPWSLDEKSILRAISSRWEWIEQKRSRIIQCKSKPLPAYVSGESHFFQGKRYILRVVEQNRKQAVSLTNAGLEMSIRPGSDPQKRQKLLENWYRQQLRSQLHALLNYWEQILKTDVREWRIKKMKTRWGSCNIQAGRIWINLELAKRSRAALEYVLVHEMLHFYERLHSPRFYSLMDKYLPDWRQRSFDLRSSHDHYEQN
jgi:predicted metal-dependent hydrolase